MKIKCLPAMVCTCVAFAMGLIFVDLAAWSLAPPSAFRDAEAVKRHQMQIVDSFVAEARAKKAPVTVAKDYRQGYLLVRDLLPTGVDSKMGKIEDARKHLYAASMDTVIRQDVNGLLNTLENHPDVGELTVLQFEGIAHRIVKQYTGNANAYKDYKDRLDRAYGKVYPGIRQDVLSIPDSRSRMVSAMVYAGIGNLMDVGQKESLMKIAADFGIEIDLSAEISAVDLIKLLRGAVEKVRREDLLIGEKELDEFIDHIFSAPGGEILYLTDNHGEIILDQLVVEQLLANGYEVTVVAKGETVRDDVTFEEALAIFQQNDIFKDYLASGKLRILSSGSWILGTDLDQIASQPLFLEAWLNARAYIAKGAGNALSLLGQKLSLAGFHIRMMKNVSTAYELLHRVRGMQMVPRSPYEMAFTYQARSLECVPANAQVGDLIPHEPREVFYNGPIRVWLGSRKLEIRNRESMPGSGQATSDYFIVDPYHPKMVMELPDDIMLGKHNPIAAATLQLEGSVSRQHLRIQRLDGGKFLFTDLGSANGTYYEVGSQDRIREGVIAENAAKFSRPAFLRDKAIITMGSAILRDKESVRLRYSVPLQIWLGSMTRVELRSAADLKALNPELSGKMESRFAYYWVNPDKPTDVIGLERIGEYLDLGKRNDVAVSKLGLSMGIGAMHARVSWMGEKDFYLEDLSKGSTAYRVGWTDGSVARANLAQILSPEFRKAWTFVDAPYDPRGPCYRADGVVDFFGNIPWIGSEQKFPQNIEDGLARGEFKAFAFEVRTLGATTNEIKCGVTFGYTPELQLFASVAVVMTAEQIAKNPEMLRLIAFGKLECRKELIERNDLITNSL